MIRRVRCPYVAPCRRQLAFKTLAQLRAQPGNSPLLNQKREATFRARLARTIIAVDAHQFRHKPRCFLLADEDVQGRRNREPSRSHFSAHQYVETGPVVAQRRHQRHILRFIVRAVLETSGNRNVEFSG